MKHYASGSESYEEAKRVGIPLEMKTGWLQYTCTCVLDRITDQGTPEEIIKECQERQAAEGDEMR